MQPHPRPGRIRVAADPAYPELPSGQPLWGIRRQREWAGPVSLRTNWPRIATVYGIATRLGATIVAVLGFGPVVLPVRRSIE